MISVVHTLQCLDYWFDTEQEVLDAMAPDERADHERMHKMIKETLSQFCPSCHEPVDHPSGDGCAAMTRHKGEKQMTQQFTQSPAKGSLIAYKAFNENMQCRGFQYEVGQTYTHDGHVEMCSSGFHACENPLDTLNYYPLIGSRFAIVEYAGEVERKSESDSKVCGATLTVKAEVKFGSLMEKAVGYIIGKAKEETSGRHSHAATLGDNSHAATSGDHSHAATLGFHSHAATPGCHSHAATLGDNSHAATSGDQSHAATSGDYSHAATSGDYSHAATSGRHSHAATLGGDSHAATLGGDSHAATSGDNSHAETLGDNSHAATSGRHSHAATLGGDSPAATLGGDSHAETLGDYSHAETLGDQSHAATSGYQSHAATSGYHSHAATSGDYSHAATLGDHSPAATSGRRSHAATSGDYSHAEAKGKNSAAAAIGYGAKARAGKTGGVALAEYDNKGNLVAMFASLVGENGIEPDTWYRLENGGPVKC